MPYSYIFVEHEYDKFSLLKLLPFVIFKQENIKFNFSFRVLYGSNWNLISRTNGIWEVAICAYPKSDFISRGRLQTLETAPVVGGLNKSDLYGKIERKTYRTI